MKIEDKIKKLQSLGMYSVATMVKFYLDSGDRKKAHRIADKNLNERYLYKRSEFVEK